MDSRLKEAIESANARITLTNNLNNLKASCKSDLMFYFGGGSFEVTPAFIGFLHSLVSMGKTFVVLLDQNNNPIRVEDLPNFFEDIMTKYFEVTNEYYLESQRLRKR